MVSEVTSLGAREINGGFVGLVYDIYGSSEALNAVRKFTVCVCVRERGWRVETFVCVKDGGRDRVIAGRYRRPRATRHHLTRGASYDPAQVKVEDLLCALLSRSH